MERPVLVVLVISMLLAVSPVTGQRSEGNTKNPYAVATYECAGIYFKTADSGPCKIRYKATEAKNWNNGLDLVYDSRDGEYRGSIINLKPGTEYEVELETSSVKSRLQIKTKSDIFPVGKTTVLPEGESDKQITITEPGRPEAYHLVTVPADSKSILNLKNVYENGIVIDADYVIIRGVEIRNPAVHGIRIRKGRHDIVIEQCHITFWGRIGGPRTYGNIDGGSDSGIYAEEGTADLTIQRNLIEDPRGASNDWETGHPNGPQGITIIQSNGGHVIRYNDIVSSGYMSAFRIAMFT